MRKISIAFFIFGAALYLLPFLYSTAKPFRAFEQNVDIKSGWILEKAFRPSHSAEHEINLSVETHPESQTAECMLTGQVQMQPCENIQSKVDVNWELYRNDQMIESGSVIGTGPSAHSQDQVSRILGSVDLKAGTNYLLKIKSLQDFPDLSRFKPKVSVETSSDYFKSNFYVLSLVQMAGFILLGISGVMGMYLWFMQIRADSKKAPAENPE